MKKRKKMKGGEKKKERKFGGLIITAALLFGFFGIVLGIDLFSNSPSSDSNHGALTGMTIEESYTDDLTPVMTDIDKPSQYKIITAVLTGYPEDAFDNDKKSIWYYDREQEEWITFDFGFNNKKQIEKYAITAGHWKGAPKAWKLYGYNSVTERYAQFATLDTKNNYTWATGETKTFYINNPNKYRYYRMQASEIVDETANMQIGEIEYMEKTASATSKPAAAEETEEQSATWEPTAEQSDAEEEEATAGQPDAEEEQTPAQSEKSVLKRFFEWLAGLF